MLFNSIDFAIFLPIVFGLYWFVGQYNLRFQNLLVVAASYLFYGWWDWRFLFLIIFSSLVDFTVGLKMSGLKQPAKKKVLLWISILVNLGFLGIFKYYNFFLENFENAFKLFGATFEGNSLNIILPVGISFYTFQTLSYTIDVYRGKLEPTRDAIAFFAFVSFFPQLVAGPIERATNLLPQFTRVRNFNYASAVDGLRQILWGLFKKMVVADNAARIANQVFNNSDNQSGSMLVMGAFFFAFQIYGDFSGYSDIAIGTARLFGVKLRRNFAFPYFSRDIGEFWRRWHISLSSWFRDYVYIPLGGSRGGTFSKVRNTFIIFVVSGFWHGANWTFIIWGLLNALYFIPLLLMGKNRTHTETVAPGKFFPPLKDFLGMGITFGLTVFAWIFFRAENLPHAASYISGIFSPSLFTLPEISFLKLSTTLFIISMLIIEWLGRDCQYGIERIGFKWNKPLRIIFYYALAFGILIFRGEEQQFIYFQF